MSKQISNPNLTDVLQELKADIFNNFNSHRIGKISKIDASNQTAEVELVDKPVIPTSNGDKLTTFPLLVDCPVYVNKSSAGGFTRPITEGEYCLVLFNDRDIDNWFDNGGINQPASKRTHNLTDGLVIAGFFPTSNSIGDYNNTATEANFGDAILKLDATEAKISKGTTEISLDSKVGIKNDTQSLQDLMQQLITLLSAFVMVDNPAAPIITVVPDNATQATIAQLLIDFNVLLKA